MDPFICHYCGYYTELKSNLRTHIERRHLREVPFNRKETKKKCTICPSHFLPSSEAAVHHYEVDHDIKMVVESHSFGNWSEFEEWKCSTEKKHCSRFIKRRSERLNRSTGQLFTYFFCHRDGFQRKSRGTGKRNGKLLGSHKINGYCPAQIKVVKSGRLISVEYRTTHVGHAADVGRLPLTKNEKRVIAEKMAAKIPMRQILEDVRGRISNNKQEKIRLINRKDLYNIAKEFKIRSGVVQHRRHFVNIESWVLENSNFVRFFKPQGSISPGYPQLNSDDFVLITANDNQLKMLKKFGKRAVCIDGTHGMDKKYQFDLTALLVTDELNEWFPCVFMLSNRCDSFLMSIFTQIVKNFANQKIQCDIFMSDMADEFYDGWCHVMPAPKRRLYSSWHVERAWRQNLDKIPDPLKRKTANSIVSILQKYDDDDEEIFWTLLHNGIDELYADPDTFEFGNYFASGFGHNCQSWAHCFRLNYNLSAKNVHIESSHKILKQFCRRGRKVKRLDLAIDAIMRSVRDKWFKKRLCLHDVRQRHKEASEVKSSNILEHENGWNIHTRAGSFNVLPTRHRSCSGDCPLKCEECATCIHVYECNCPDFKQKWMMCKHIHLIAGPKGEAPSSSAPLEICLDDYDDDDRFDVCEYTISSEDNTVLIVDRSARNKNVDGNLNMKLIEMDKIYKEIRQELSSAADVNIASDALKRILPTVKAARIKPRPPITIKEIKTSKKVSPQKKLFFPAKTMEKFGNNASPKPSPNKEVALATKWLLTESEFDDFDDRDEISNVPFATIILP